MKLRTCTVRELMDALEDEAPEAVVVFASNYGDIGKTQQVHTIVGNIEEVAIEESAYSDSGWASTRSQASILT